ncbi:MAG TPA: DUF4149 domain-containing protein [Methylomirabilota bacterium]|nr:DUF4149 domain-containing protein [Methylomirabilota bacterium]
MRIMAAGAIVCWLGVMAFFGAVIAPAAFTTLDREAAGRFVSAVFPRYYAVGAALGGLALLALLVRLLLRDDRSGGWVSLLLVALMLASTLYAWLVVLPAAHAAREALHQTGAATGAVSIESLAFTRLHRLSSVLNGVSLLAGILGLVAVGLRR